MSATQLLGVPGDPITDGDTLLFPGPTGAGNQNSPASVNVLDGSRPILRYRSDTTQIGGIAGTFGDGRFIFLSFGLEGVSGAGTSTRRDQFLASALAWLGAGVSSSPMPAVEVPDGFVLEAAYPNPFNPSTTLRFRAPLGTKNVRLELFNVLGQKVRTLYTGAGTGQVITLRWDGMTDAGTPAASGTFLCRLAADQAVQMQTLRLVR